MTERLLSVVIPVYNEANTLGELLRRLTSSLTSTGLAWEVVFVNDGSHDASGDILAEAMKEDGRIRVVTLSRNFGHQVALSAGLDFAEGSAVIMMDSDLQDPPEVLPALVHEWLNGAEVVLTVKSKRGESRLMALAFWGFYRVLRLLAGVDIPAGAGIFSLMDRRVADAVKRLPERSRYLVGLLAWVGFRQAIVPYERPGRPDGRSRVGTLGLVHLALDAIFAFSIIPLRLITLLGFMMSLWSFVAGGFIFALRLFTNEVQLPGWASIIVAGTMLGGVQLVVLGILGEYVGRIFDEVKGRPLYVVRAVEGRTPHEQVSPSR